MPPVQQGVLVSIMFAKLFGKCLNDRKSGAAAAEGMISCLCRDTTEHQVCVRECVCECVCVCACACVCGAGIPMS